MNKFYSLKVLEIESLTAESVKIVFDTSDSDIFNFKASLYKSSAISSLTPAKIIKIASAPWCLDKWTWYVSIKKSLHKIGRIISVFSIVFELNLILEISERLPKKKSSSVKIDKHVAFLDW